MIKKILTLFMVGVMTVISALTLVGCGSSVDEYKAYSALQTYTEEQHIADIKKLIDEKYMTDGVYTDYTIKPLYDEEEKLTGFAVDFEPKDFFYIRLRYVGDFPKGHIYIIDSAHRDKLSDKGWFPYVMNENNAWRYYIGDKENEIYEKSYYTFFEKYGNATAEDENGEYIVFNKSHFKATDNLITRGYLIRADKSSETYFLPAIKDGDKFIDLTTMKEFDGNVESLKSKWDTRIKFYYNAIFALDL
ncbi:MAG: hypothetical protein IJ706_00445 [Clostridia bacterium]|nr:hypothetical protein [Clostridia bacterium]MBR1675769.1 hypothetical protein [Clostridia bacterium]